MSETREKYLQGTCVIEDRGERLAEEIAAVVTAALRDRVELKRAA
jgi:hypothetical protein